MTSKFLAEKYFEESKSDTKWSVKGFRRKVRMNVKISVLRVQCYRAKTKALKIIQRSHREQYGHLWECCQIIKETNPGSTMFLDVRRPNDTGLPTFRRLYCCLAACKHGFIKGCRPIIGFDGCHLKGSFGGQLLAVVGKDDNKNIFFIAWAIVEAETKDS